MTTVFQRVGLADRIELEPADALAVEGFEDDSLVRGALEALAGAAAVEPAWHVRIEKEIPVAAGLGGGSSDAAAALALANETLDQPLPPDRLHDLAARLGADVPFFLAPGPQLGEGDGSRLTPLELPQGCTVAARPARAARPRSRPRRCTGRSTTGTARTATQERRARLLAALAAGDLAALPPNDLASSPLAARLEALGALRADVSGAGPAVYGLFADEAAAAEAVRGSALAAGPGSGRRRGRLRA